ncbi:MAG TPA: DMT family transporter [Opitutales bacterium]|nr:DMT family transporter [Opitutales bacterium]
MRPKSINLFQVNFAVLIWGGTAMFAKGIALPVTDLTCLRSLFAAVALLLFIKLRGQSAAVESARHFGLMIGLGLFLCLHWLTYFQALKISSAAVAILALHTYPVVTALIEPVLFREKLKKFDVALALAAFSSVFIMMPELSLSNKTTQGILLGILSGLFFMSRNLMIRKLLRTYTSSTLMFWQTLVTGLVLVPFLFFSGEFPYSQNSILLLLLLAVVFTALPQTLFASGLKNLSAKTVGILASLLPVYGAIFGYLIHDERVEPRTALGGALILSCVIIETVRQASPEKSP